MRLWFSSSGEVPIYRQLVTQISLAILSGDLKPGDRLPSTRELARRFGIHPNTISAGYRELEREGFTETRHGSGVYVSPNADTPTTPEQILDQHIAAFFRAVRELNLSATMIRERVSRWIASPPPDHFLLIDPDADLREILLTEIRQLTQLPASGGTVEDCASPDVVERAIPLCRPSKTKLVRAALPMGTELVTLQIRSAHRWLDPWLPEIKGELMGVVSHWPEFLTIARTMLIAAGLSPESLIFRDPRRPRWSRGLDQTSAILCDAYTAATRALPKGPRIIIFPLLADSAREELARFSQPPVVP
ncbi:GntR family transcriptional regulator [Acidicapsa dinghuensis]|uniref:GntR family transcriptional regulator n=1 Tax=Acidicapsa dinghuensis TaxID=2218256 RepID=A0ABW1EGR2_9BACT|nr:GntR family transcriptional regulator [Acidicapsa dinghuensis]